MNAVTARPSANESYVESLKQQLQQREFHLAELIDEVVHAERTRDEAVAHSRQALIVPPVSTGSVGLERAFQELLSFDLTVFSDVLIPVLLEAIIERSATDSAIGTMLRHDAIHNTLEGLLEDRGLQRSTQELVYKVLRQSSVAREALSSGGGTPQGLTRVSANAIQLERAVVLSGLLLRRQGELLDSLSHIREALNGVYNAEVSGHDYGADVKQQQPVPSRPTPRSGGSESDNGTTAAAATAYVRKLERERDALQLQLLDTDQRHSVVDALVEEKKLLEQEVIHLQQKLISAHMQISEEKRQPTTLASSRATPHRSVPAPPSHSPDRAGDEAADMGEKEPETVRALQQQLAHARVENQQLHEALALARRAPPSSQLVLSPLSPQAVMHEKVAELESMVSSLRGNLHTMESRVETLQGLREKERERIMARHEQELARIRKERDECEAVVHAMSSELHRLATQSRASQPR